MFIDTRSELMSKVIFPKRSKRLRHCLYSAVFAALTAVMAQIALPFGQIPVSLATFAVLCSAALLPGMWGTASMLVYIAMGVCGLPVFSGFRSFTALAGPTGGYIAGYVLCAATVGLVRILCGKRISALYLALGMVAGTLLLYITGTVWFCVYSGCTVGAALGVAVMPYVPFDALKIVAATFASQRIRHHINL